MEWEKDVTKAYALAAALLLASTAIQAAELKISKESFGESWPLLVDGGTLSCVVDAGSGVEMVTFIHPTGTYALNGSANSRAKQRGWFPVNTVWRPNPAVPGTRMDISVLIKPGLKLCSR
jgi:hypothetical protein